MNQCYGKLSCFCSVPPVSRPRARRDFYESLHLSLRCYDLASTASVAWWISIVRESLSVREALSGHAGGQSVYIARGRLGQALLKAVRRWEGAAANLEMEPDLFDSEVEEVLNIAIRASAVLSQTLWEWSQSPRTVLWRFH